MSSDAPNEALDVLVSDDDDPSRAATISAVSSLGYLCRGARDGQEALEEHRREPAAIVLTDWNMPRLDGLGLCQSLKAQPSPPYVILMTAQAERGRLYEAIRGGADEFLRKPFELEELEVRLLAAVRIARAQRELAKLNGQLARERARESHDARTDSLTAIANRRQLDEDLAHAIADARRYGRRCSLAICDVDHFKRYNDENGHLAGDFALHRIATALHDGVRANDSVYRYGGEEFVVLFPTKTVVEATQAMDRLRSLVEALALRREAGAPRDIVTLSAGVAELGSEEGTVAWMARADEALYRAKSEGRNCVRAAEASWLGAPPSPAPSAPEGPTPESSLTRCRSLYLRWPRPLRRHEYAGGAGRPRA